MASVLDRGSDTIADFNLLTPRSKTEITAALLKSSFREQKAPTDVPTFSIGPSDPIWDMVDEAAPSERLSPRHRTLLIAAAGTVPWLSLAVFSALQA